MTLGAGLSFGFFSAGAEIDSSDEELGLSGSFVLFSPRVGYRVSTSENFDVIPRGGITIISGGGTASEVNCFIPTTYDPDTGALIDSGPTECREDENELDFSVTAATLEVAGAYRFTDSLKLMLGASADVVVSADASVEDDDGDKDEEDLDGSWNTLQLWIGLGGYF